MRGLLPANEWSWPIKGNRRLANQERADEKAIGKSTEAGKEGTIVHNAFAVVSYDDKAKQTRWHAYTGTLGFLT